MKTEILPATAIDIETFYGEPPKRSMRAFVGLADGVPLACFGLYYDTGRMVLFSDIKPEARRYRKTLVSGAFRVMDLARELGVPVHAVAGCVDGSVRLLERLGFTRQGNLYVWEGV